MTGWEKPGFRDTPMKAGQARSASEHTCKVVGLFLASRATFQPGWLEKRLLEK